MLSWITDILIERTLSGLKNLSLNMSEISDKAPMACSRASICHQKTEGERVET